MNIPPKYSYLLANILQILLMFVVVWNLDFKIYSYSFRKIYIFCIQRQLAWSNKPQHFNLYCSLWRPTLFGPTLWLQEWSSHQFLPQSKCEKMCIIKTFKRSQLLQNCYIVHISRFFTVWTISEFEHSRPFENFDTLDPSRIWTCWTLPFIDHSIFLKDFIYYSRVFRSAWVMR